MPGPVVVFGGRGLVGASICRELVRRGVSPVIAASRSAGAGAGGPLDDAVVQKDGVDALKPETLSAVLAGAQGVVISIGIPPWILDKDLAKQMNGVTNVNILRAAAEQKVPRVVLINATMPTWRLISGYREGKELAESEARNYPDQCGCPCSVLILKPSAIGGTRYDVIPGRGVNLGLMMAPMRFVFKSLPSVCSFFERLLPSCFAGVLRPPVYAEELASAAADALVSSSATGGVTTLGPDSLVGYVSALKA
mmetsp:Transcript_17410/g.31382  ORF Transcript_17410/g.31382 Transcript_17410/m.31382 type:complete len:252 (+) Transcript_17410:53-808(+)